VPGEARGTLYKWLALSNTTLGMLSATTNASIVIIALPAIFRGIHLNPLTPGNVSYLLWMLMGYLVVSAVLVVTLGRLGDIYGRVRMYNLGFAVFALGALALPFDPMSGPGGALWLIGWRVVQATGGAMLMANSPAILTDAFPADQRGTAMGINQVAGISGSFIGLILGGILAAVDWRLVFIVSVPIGIGGAIWSYLSLQEVGLRTKARIDWLGNVTFALGLIGLLTGITYGIQPYGGHVMGWTSPVVLTGPIGGVVLLVAFCFIELRVESPMFDLSLLRIRAFAAGNAATLLASIARGGLQFMLIIWLQGIWLILHGYNYKDTPLWSGIYLLPLTFGFIVAGPVSGWLSDRHGPAGSPPAAAGLGGCVRRAAGAADQLPVPGLRHAHFRGRRGDGPVLRTQRGRDHEQRARPSARRAEAAGRRLRGGAGLGVLLLPVDVDRGPGPEPGPADGHRAGHHDAAVLQLQRAVPDPADAGLAAGDQQGQPAVLRGGRAARAAHRGADQSRARRERAGRLGGRGRGRRLRPAAPPGQVTAGPFIR
jgi:MFS family permease